VSEQSEMDGLEGDPPKFPGAGKGAGKGPSPAPGGPQGLPPLEEPHGMDHIAGLGDAASSLGLLATLVMAIAFEALLKETLPDKEVPTLFLALANIFAVFTVTYAILEYYYVKAVLGARYKNKRSHSQKQWNSMVDTMETMDRGMYTDAQFVETATQKFDSLNGLRGISRDCLWMSLVCMFSAMVTFKTKGVSSILTPNLDPPDQDGAGSKGALLVLVWLDVILLLAWAFLKDAFFRNSLALAVIVTVPCAGDALFFKSDLPTMAILTDAIILINIAIVPMTVKNFRGIFVQFLKETNPH
jgi:hypothetical protein